VSATATARRSGNLVIALIVALWSSTTGVSAAGERIGTRFPDDFPQIIDASLGVPVIGSEQPVRSSGRRATAADATDDIPATGGGAAGSLVLLGLALSLVPHRRRTRKLA
jgi:hypothetical protein